MKKLSYKELKKLWIDFYTQRGHVEIPSASVVPDNDASVLFINSGMHPLVPYLMGESHPSGKRLCNIQKCVRTGDIDDVGDPTHLTFFEMMGNWSLGDYFKKEKVAWTWEFITGKDWLNIDPKLISVTCFEGDNTAPKDTESAQYWKEQGVPASRIYYLNKSENWWQLPSGTGPCGSCSESFYDTGKKGCGKDCNPSCNCGKYIEIGNDVYMEYIIDSAGSKPKLNKQKNVDTGFGLERLLCLVNGYKNVYDSELFAPAIKKVAESMGTKTTSLTEDSLTKIRVLCEHTRAAVAILADGVIPSNTGQGYVLRRLIRRAVRMANALGLERGIYVWLIDFFAGYLGEYYQEIKSNLSLIKTEFDKEVSKFEKTLAQGIKEFEKVLKFVGGAVLSGKTAFKLYETYGFPIELTKELASERGMTINMDEYEHAKQKHTQASQTANAGAFKGGLADTTGTTTALHTSTHLLHSALRSVFGNDLHQKGSNITPERLRFDFNLDHKMTPEQIKDVEQRVNKMIQSKLVITHKEMNLEDAKKLGAIGIFNSKYGEKVKVYFVGNEKSPTSVEFCGGPHVTNTKELGIFKIQKEESVSAGIRRIKAVLV